VLEGGKKYGTSGSEIYVPYFFPPLYFKSLEDSEQKESTSDDSSCRCSLLVSLVPLPRRVGSALLASRTLRLRQGVGCTHQ
jgi:hypothetical protein